MCLTPCDSMDYSTPGFPVLPSPKACSNSCPLVSDGLQASCLCHPLLFLPSIFPSIRVFFNESALHIRWPKNWSFSFSISPSNEHSGLISLRIYSLNLLTVQGSLKSLLLNYSSETSILQHSAFFMVQLLHSYITTGKTIALTIYLRTIISFMCLRSITPFIPFFFAKFSIFLPIFYYICFSV